MRQDKGRRPVLQENSAHPDQNINRFVTSTPQLEDAPNVQQDNIAQALLNANNVQKVMFVSEELIQNIQVIVQHNLDIHVLKVITVHKVPLCKYHAR